MALNSVHYSIPNGPWEQVSDRVRQIIQSISSLDIPKLETSIASPLSKDTDYDSDTYGQITLNIGSGLVDDSGTLIVDDTVYLPYTGATANVDLGAYDLATTGTGNFGPLNATGAVDFDSTVNIDGTLDVTGATGLDGAVIIDDTLNVTGGCDFDSTVNIDGTLDVGGVSVFQAVVGLSKAVPGSFLHAYVDNTLTTKANNLILEQDGTGDVGLTFSLTGSTDWTIGVDNSASNKLVFSARDIDVENILLYSSMDLSTSGNLRLNPSGAAGGGALYQFAKTTTGAAQIYNIFTATLAVGGGSGLAGHGLSYTFQIENSAGALHDAGKFRYEWTDPTAGSEDSKFIVQVLCGGALTDILKVDGKSVQCSTPGTASLVVDSITTYNKAMSMIVADPSSRVLFDSGGHLYITSQSTANIRNGVIAGGTNQLVIQNDGDISVTKDVNCADVVASGRLSSGTLTITASSNTTDVSGINALFVNTTSGDVTLSGLVGGVDGQNLAVAKIVAVNDLILQHENASHGGDDLFMHQLADEIIDAGGVMLVFNGTTSKWYDVSHAKHV